MHIQSDSNVNFRDFTPFKSICNALYPTDDVLVPAMTNQFCTVKRSNTVLSHISNTLIVYSPAARLDELAGCTLGETNSNIATIAMSS